MNSRFIKTKKEITYDNKAFCIFSITSIFAMISAIICSKMTLNIVSLLVAISGVHFYSSAKPTQNMRLIKDLIIPYWFLLLILVSSITTSLVFSKKLLITMVVIAIFIRSIFFYKGVDLRKTITGIASVLVFTIVITNSANYVFSKVDSVTVLIDDKFKTVTNVAGSRTEKYTLIVTSEDGGKKFLYAPVDVRKDTYEEAVVNNTIVLVERRSILTQSLSDPRIDSARAINKLKIGNLQFADFIIVIVGIIIGLKVAFSLFINRKKNNGL